MRRKGDPITCSDINKFNTVKHCLVIMSCIYTKGLKIGRYVAIIIVRVIMY